MVVMSIAQFTDRSLISDLSVVQPGSNLGHAEKIHVSETEREITDGKRS